MSDPGDTSPEQWLRHPAHELYGIYADTVSSRFSGFTVLPFMQAQASLSTPFESHLPGQPVEQDLLDVIVSRESMDGFASTMSDYIKATGIDDWLDHWGSVAFVTDHGQFTDVPITAEVLGRLGVTKRENTIQVISKMISVMSLDLGQGSFTVTDKLRQISSLVKTVPRLDGSPSKELENFREDSNTEASDVIRKALADRGVVLVESFIGRHNQVSEDGKTLYINEPNINTARLLMGRNVKVVPLYIHCPTFGDDGSISTPNMSFEIFEPIDIDPAQARTASRHIVEQFRRATENTIGEQYENGVKVKSWAQQKAERGMRKVAQVLTRNPVETTTNY